MGYGITHKVIKAAIEFHKTQITIEQKYKKSKHNKSQQNIEL